MKILKRQPSMKDVYSKEERLYKSNI